MDFFCIFENMKIILKVISIIFIALAALVFLLDQYFIGIMFLVAGGFAWLVAKNNGKPIEIKEKPSNNKKDIPVEKPTYDISGEGGNTYQLLESTRLVLDSNNPDVVFSNLNYLKITADRLSNVQKNNESKYKAEALTSLERYKTDYYDVIIHEKQIEYLLNPKNLSIDYDELKCTFIKNALDRYVIRQEFELNKLKTAKGKVNRYRKMNDQILGYNELVKHSECTSHKFTDLFKYIDDRIDELES